MTKPLLYFAVIAGMLGVYGYFVMLRDSATDIRVDPVCMSDCKSGCGCLRPRLQADGSWKMEFNNEDWRENWERALTKQNTWSKE